MQTVWDFNKNRILVIGKVDKEKLQRSIEFFELHSELKEPTIYKIDGITWDDDMPGAILDWEYQEQIDINEL